MTESKATVIVISNQKGGCGKTTTTIQLATGLSQKGEKVLVIDADQQHSARNWTANKEWNFAVRVLAAGELVHQLVQQWAPHYHWILIDCPPASQSLTTDSALLVSDWALIPLLCAANDLWALTKTLAAIRKIQQENPRLGIRILYNQYRQREKLSQEIRRTVEQLAVKSLQATLGNRVAFRESAARGKSIFQLGDQQAQQEVRNLSTEIRSMRNESRKNKQI